MAVKAKKHLVIMGGNGSGTIVAEAAIAASRARAPYFVKGFLNDSMEPGAKLYELPVLGRLEDWQRLPKNTVFLPALHNVRDMRGRLSRIEALNIPAARWANVRHPQASVARDVTVGYGTFIGAFAVVEPGAKIGNFVCIRSGAYISHDTTIGDFVFVGPNSTIAGRSTIGRGTHVGPNSAVRDQLSVAEFTIIGIGAVVVESIKAPAVVAGNPARRFPDK